MKRSDDFIVSVNCRRCDAEVSGPWHSAVAVMVSQFTNLGWTFGDHNGWWCQTCSGKRRRR